MMADYQGLHWTNSIRSENPQGPHEEYKKNKYIFFKHHNQHILKSSTILVNPRFKDNSKVFINPNFSANAAKNIVSRPHIYVNPKLIKSIPSNSTSNLTVPTSQSVNRYPLKVIPTDTSGRVLVSTKSKLIKVPELKKNNVLCTSTNVAKNIDFSQDLYKKVDKVPHKDLTPINYRKIVYTRTKIINTPMQSHKKSVRRHSLNNRYKYVKANGIKKKINKTIVRSKHKIINNVIDTSKYKKKECVQSLERNSPNSRKRYVFVNKYNSSSFLANNVILKNTSQKRLININGILYQNSPSALKRTSLNMRQQKDLLSTNLFTPLKSQSQISITKLSTCKFKRKISGDITEEYQGKYKLVRPRIASASKLKKSNVPCPVYKRFGKCNGQKRGTCIKIHNSNQIVLCSKFLQGACIKKNCLLSHKVSHEKMPTCKFFLEGLCSRDDCQYLHVKISSKADICKNFLEGFCEEGTKCEKRHQLLCPEYEKFQKCSRRKCEYPHINSKATFDGTSRKLTTKVPKMREKEIVKENVIETFEKPNLRYYLEVENRKEIEKTLISKRPKLGSLPSYIPFSEDSQVLCST